MYVYFGVLFLIFTLLFYINFTRHNRGKGFLWFVLSSCNGFFAAVFATLITVAFFVEFGAEENESSEMIVSQVKTINNHGIILFHDLSISSDLKECEKILTFNDEGMAKKSENIRVVKERSYKIFLGDKIGNKEIYRAYIPEDTELSNIGVTNLTKEISIEE